MATIPECWRVIVEPNVLAETAAQAERIARVLDEAEAVCQQTWIAVQDASVVDLDDTHEAARRAITEAREVVRVAGLRLRYVAAQR